MGNSSSFFKFFSVSVKVLPVTPLLSGVFVHRVFFAYFVRFEGGWGNAYTSLVHTGEHLINLQQRRKSL